MAVFRGGYWRSSEVEKFPPKSISKTWFTHLFYATVAIDPETYKIRLSDIDQTWMGRFTSVISNNSDVKCMLSIGGDTEASRAAFSKMVSTSAGRKRFIEDSIKVARQNGFHGLDLYWKYPASETEFDMQNLGLLFEAWRRGLIDDSSATGKPQLLLSTIAYFAPKFFPPNDKKAYPFEAIKDNVDFVNLVCYDYHGNQDFEATAEHALLYDQPGKKSTDYGILSWINDARVPQGKMVIGLPLYGRTWTLKDPNKNWIGAPAAGVMSNGSVMDYSDIMIFNKDHHATVVDDENTVSTYSYAGQDWIGYDSEYSIKKKVQYAKNHALGGYFFWALDMDKDHALPEQAFDTWN
ncbi:hypothetical protein ACJW31_04G147300 [Castanea mollissima]